MSLEEESLLLRGSRTWWDGTGSISLGREKRQKELLGPWFNSTHPIPLPSEVQTRICLKPPFSSPGRK